MINRGIASFGLDYGHCPPWLFNRMVKLGREMIYILVSEYGPDEFIKRIADPSWFQSFGTVLAFDWNASGLTTILTAALKEAIRGEEENLGIFICGGKGKTSLKTPDEIRNWGERLALESSQYERLVYNSKMSAKVDSALVQDGFELYHHSFFFSQNGHWSVVQQGMNKEKQLARRYHWYSDNISDLVNEPHSGISSSILFDNVLNLTSKDSDETRKISIELVQNNYLSLMKDVKLIRKYYSRLSQSVAIKMPHGEQLSLLNLEDREFKYHMVINEDFTKSRYLEKVLAYVTDVKPKSYESLISLKGVGGKTVRALALVGEIIYGAKPSYEDPARYSFAHGGKDATPYPVDIKTYDETVLMLESVILKTKLSLLEKNRAMQRLLKNKK